MLGKKILTTVVIVSVWAFVFAGSAVAATLDFNPDSTTVAVDDSFSVAIDIDAGTDQVAGTDIYINYDKDLFTLQSVSGGSYFPLVNNIPTTGRVYISGVVANGGEYKTSTGTVATVVFKAIAAGESELEFDCDLSKTDTSKIVKNDINVSNIINCSSIKTHKVTVTNADGTTTSTTSGGTTSTKLPASGVLDGVYQYVTIGGILLLLGIVIKFGLRI